MSCNRHLLLWINSHALQSWHDHAIRDTDSPEDMGPKASRSFLSLQHRDCQSSHPMVSCSCRKVRLYKGAWCLRAGIWQAAHLPRAEGQVQETRREINCSWIQKDWKRANRQGLGVDKESSHSYLYLLKIWDQITWNYCGQILIGC